MSRRSEDTIHLTHVRRKSPLIKITSADESPPLSPDPSIQAVSKEGSTPCKNLPDRKVPDSSNCLMLYNKYGELIDVEKELQPVGADEVTVTQAMRLINRVYYNEVSGFRSLHVKTKL
jgi:hypothetical protein